MNVNDIQTLVGTLGFPIVMCGVMVWINWKQSKQHSEDTAKLREALEGNTVILTKLYERLNRGDTNGE